MAIRQIRLIGDEILAKKSRKVENVNERILEILDDMAETMYSARGLGLAAVQVGVLRRLIVVDVGEGLIKLINPEIVSSEGEEQSVEGCLSIPGYQGKVNRPAKVTVRALDEKGEELVIEAEGIFKKALCHELDHLDGILYSDIALEMYELAGDEPDEEDEEEDDDELKQESGVQSNL